MEYRSPEEIKRAAMSETNKAFERYMGKDTDDDLRSVYRQSAKVISIDKTDNGKKPKIFKSWWRRRESNPFPSISATNGYSGLSL